MSKEIMGTNTISTVLAKQMIKVAAINSVSIISTPDGWFAMLKLGLTEKPLGTQRTDKPRIWRSLDRCVEYLKKELHIVRFELLDASQSGNNATKGGKSRIDASLRLRNAHEAAAHDKWFRQQVEEGVAEADAPDTSWISNYEANASWTKKRDELFNKAEGGAN